MLLTIAAILLGSASVCDAVCDPDPVCQAVCGTPDRKQQLAVCEMKLDGASRRAVGMQSLAIQCADRLAACEARPTCPAKKPAKKRKPTAKPAAPAEAPPVVKQEQEQSQQVVINVVVPPPQPQHRPAPPPKKAEPADFGVGGRGAMGITCNPSIFGLVGVRGRYLPLHLGLEVNTQFAYGHSAQVMVYPVQGPIAWHLDFGGLLFVREGAQFNLLAGTGVEVEIVPHFSATADWRMTIPKNFSLGEALLSSQLMLGLMLHTW